MAQLIPTRFSTWRSFPSKENRAVIRHIYYWWIVFGNADDEQGCVREGGNLQVALW